MCPDPALGHAALLAIPGEGDLDMVVILSARGALSERRLRDVSLTIEPGQKVALVGRTGSGKSTLAMLLLGLYAPTDGEILYDGVPMQALNVRTLRSRLGVVLQESFLVSGSIRENIAFNDPSMSLDQVVQAAHLAAIHDEIARMGMGYETMLAEGGAGLSGGQRQRLSIARALSLSTAPQK
jgi:ATP-binding cassette, subfamily B, bacterial